jgi:predicted kinase
MKTLGRIYEDEAKGQGGFESKHKKSKQFVLVLGGPPAVGKSTIAHEMRKIPHLAIVEVDVLKCMEKKYPPFSKEIAVNNAISVMENFLEKGYNVLLVEPFSNKEFLDDVVESANANGANCFIVFLDADLGTLKKRNNARERRKKISEFFLKKHKDRIDSYSYYKITTENKAPLDVFDEIMCFISG